MVTERAFTGNHKPRLHLCGNCLLENCKATNQILNPVLGLQFLDDPDHELIAAMPAIPRLKLRTINAKRGYGYFLLSAPTPNLVGHELTGRAEVVGALQIGVDNAAM